MRRAWTKRDEARLRQLYPAHSWRECSAILGRCYGAIKTKVKLLGIQKQPLRVWSPAELKQLRARYPGTLTKTLAQRFGRPLCSVHGKAAKLGLKKSAAFIASPACRMQPGAKLGATFRFQKGHVPANKSLRRPGWFRGRMRETQFQKGQRSHNWLPIGTVKANADGYLRAKISDAPEPPGRKGARSPNWQFVHRRVWEAAHGAIPKAHRIWWKDGNHANCSIENLELLNDREHMRRTTIHNLPPELKSSLRALGTLRRSITMIRKREAA